MRFARFPRRRVKGFTLVELLVVLGLLSAFTYLAFRLLSGGLSIWRIADESRDQDERARVILEMLRRDLGVADGSPRSRFVVDHGDVTMRGEAHACARLRFVRTVNRAEESRMRLGFAAAAGAESAPAVNGSTVDTAAGPEVKLPTTGTDADDAARSIGLLEVAYAPVPEVNLKDRDSAVFVLRRAAHLVDLDNAEDSVFASDFFDRGKRGFMDRSSELAGGILHFGVLLASQDTKSFTASASAGGPETAWDSTRFQFLTPKSTGLNRFTLASAAALPPRERVFPRRAQFTLILEREDADRRRPRLARAVDATSMEFPLDDPRPIAVTDGEFVKIGGEWIQAASSDRGVLRARVRGVLGTHSTSHNASLALHRGRVFTLEIPIDCARDAAIR